MLAEALVDHPEITNFVLKANHADSYQGFLTPEVSGVHWECRVVGGGSGKGLGHA